MQQETFTEKQIPEGKIYNDRKIWAGSYLGGPLVAGYLISENFKAFGEHDKVWKTWLISILALVLVIVTLFIPLFERVSNFLYCLCYAISAHIFVQLYQRRKIDAHIEAGGRLYGWWRLIGISILGTIITIIPLFGAAYLAGDSSDNTTVKTYGNLKHEILFDKNNITEAEVDKIADALTKRDYFTDNAKAYVYVKKIKNTYEIFFSCNESVKTEPTAIPFFTALHKELQGLLPENKIVVVLVVDSMDNVIKRIE
jgi:hypothetical protein